MYKKIIKDLTSYIVKTNGIEEKNKDRIRFGLEILVSVTFSTLLSLGTAVILGIFKYVLAVLVGGAIIKCTAGGIHLDSPAGCSLLTCIISNTLGYISISLASLPKSILLIVITITTTLSLLCLYFWSPADNEKKPITNPDIKNLLKSLSLVIASIYIILSTFTICVLPKYCTGLSLSLILTLTLQSLMITPLFFQIKCRCQKLFSYILSILAPKREVKK